VQFQCTILKMNKNYGPKKKNVVCTNIPCLLRFLLLFLLNDFR